MPNDYSPYGRELTINQFPDTVYMSLHSADPEGSGLNEVAVARKTLNLQAPDANKTRYASETQVDFEVPAGTTVAYLGYYDAATGGNFLAELALETAQTYDNPSVLRVLDPGVDTNLDCAVTGAANGFSTYSRNQVLSALPSSVYVSLHSADPGDTGASELGVSRQAATLDPAAGGVRVAQETEIDFNMSAGDTVTHVGIFDASTGGNFIAAHALESSSTFDASAVFRVLDLAMGMNLTCN